MEVSIKLKENDISASTFHNGKQHTVLDMVHVTVFDQCTVSDRVVEDKIFVLSVQYLVINKLLSLI